MSNVLHSLSQQEQLNFLLTNRVPRRLLTHFIGWYSGIESRWLTRATIWLWQLFADDLKLEEARQRDFRSLGECFTRQLKEGARPLDADPRSVVSPCDAIVGESGRIGGATLYQAKGFPYELSDLVPDPVLQAKYRDGYFVTLRLKSSMYHRFHAPLDCRVDGVSYISGDTWNVNPISLRRIEKLYCKNERAVIDLKLDNPDSGICLVAVAAILVASIRLHGLPEGVDVRKAGPALLDLRASHSKGDELGYFQHGSTIVLFATQDFSLRAGLQSGNPIAMGEPLLSKVSPRHEVRPAEVAEPA